MHMRTCVCTRVHVYVFPAVVLKSVFTQRAHQKTLEQTVEEMKQQRTTAAKKQQELTACLSLDGYVGGSLKKGRDEGSCRGAAEMNLTRNHEVAGSIPGVGSVG